MIRDHIVCGVNDTAVQKHLLAEPGLTYAKAMEIAQGAETAAQSLRELRPPNSESSTIASHALQQEIFKVTATPAEHTPLTCYRCVRRGHTVANGRVDKEVKCHHCGTHLQRACRSKAKSGPRGPGKRWFKPAVGKIQQEEEESESESESDNATLYHLRSSHALPIIVEVKVDDCCINMEVDTGVSLSLSNATFQGLWPGRNLDTTHVRLQAYSGQPIPVLGCCCVNVWYKGQTEQFPLFVVEGKGPTLIGRDWLSQIQLDWRQIHHVHSPSVQAVLARYPSVFQDG